MPNQTEIAWAVEYVENGRRVVSLDPKRHSTPEEAKRAFEDSLGIPWKELERRGARVFQQAVPAIAQVPHGS
ncbi:MAG TPA: hypothetical protein VK569_03620 [Bacteroidota bacterium]|nr:hypothetical protein [Bacteroidota bacterium]